MSDKTDKAVPTVDCDTAAGGDPCAHGLRSTASTLPNPECASNGAVEENQIHPRWKKRRCAARRARPHLATATSLSPTSRTIEYAKLRFVAMLNGRQIKAFVGPNS
jgi:hypothetical protein